MEIAIIYLHWIKFPWRKLQNNILLRINKKQRICQLLFNIFQILSKLKPKSKPFYKKINLKNYNPNKKPIKEDHWESVY
jgi:hypothetical protein